MDESAPLRSESPAAESQGEGGAVAWLEAHPNLVLSSVMTASIAAVWLAFASDLSPLYRYFDGPYYAYVAQTFYQVPVHHPFEAYFSAAGLGSGYLASYLPTYPLLIRVLSIATGGSLLPAMLLATLVSSVASVILFHRLLREWNLVSWPLWTALLFCFLPPRWFVYHTVGATEPLFLCFVFATFLADRRGRTGWVLSFIALASLTRISGVLLGPVFVLVYLQRRDWRSLALLPLSGLGVLALFTVYQLSFGDFFSYFRWQETVLRSIPFLWYQAATERAGPEIIEFFFWTYFLYGVGTLALWKHREFFFYSLVYSVFACFLYNDLARMFVPAAPFALLVGFDPVLRKPAVRWILPLIVFGVIIYARGIIPRNGVSEPTWEALLRVLG